MSNLEWVYDIEKYGTCAFCKEPFKLRNIAISNHTNWGIWAHPDCTLHTTKTLVTPAGIPLISVKTNKVSDLVDLLLYNEETRESVGYIDFSHMNILQKDLSGIKFLGRFQATRIYDCDLTGADFSQATFDNFSDNSGIIKNYKTSFYDCLFKDTIMPTTNYAVVNSDLNLWHKIKAYNGYKRFPDFWATLGESFEKFQIAMQQMSNFLNNFDRIKIYHESEAYQRSKLIEF